MSYAPATIQAARRLWLDTITTLGENEVGIKGDDRHARSGSSYHLGRDALRSDSYSIVESSRDRSGLTDAASALDIGSWSRSVAGKSHSLRSFSLWLVAQCKAGAADTKDIREVIYSPDGHTVKRWDRLGKRSTGDDSHLAHTHISYYRDSEHHDKAPLFRRYFTEIGLLEDDMATPKEIIEAEIGDKGRHLGNSVDFLVDGAYDAKARLTAVEGKLDKLLALLTPPKS